MSVEIVIKSILRICFRNDHGKKLWQGWVITVEERLQKLILPVKVMNSLGERRPKSITKTPYWRETHKDIPKSVYKLKEIEDKSNCKACHKDFEHGNMDDMNIIYRP